LGVRRSYAPRRRSAPFGRFDARDRRVPSAGAPIRPGPPYRRHDAGPKQFGTNGRALVQLVNLVRCGHARRATACDVVGVRVSEGVRAAGPVARAVSHVCRTRAARVPPRVARRALRVRAPLAPCHTRSIRCQPRSSGASTIAAASGSQAEPWGSAPGRVQEGFPDD